MLFGLVFLIAFISADVNINDEDEVDVEGVVIQLPETDVVQNVSNYYSNGTWNITYETWAYNQTAPANTYADSVNASQSSWINNIFLKIADMFTKTEITNMISGNVTASYNSSYEYWNNDSLIASYNSSYDEYSYNQSDGSYNSTYATWAYNQSDGSYNSTYENSINSINTTANIQNLINDTGVYSTYNSTYATIGSVQEENLNITVSSGVGIGTTTTTFTDEEIIQVAVFPTTEGNTYQFSANTTSGGESVDTNRMTHRGNWTVAHRGSSVTSDTVTYNISSATIDEVFNVRLRWLG